MPAALTPLTIMAGLSVAFGLPFLLFAGGGPFTGRKMLAFACAMFGIIIAVNVALAVWAVDTFPGLEVANSYVASQDFNRERAAQSSLGWTVTPAYDGHELTLRIADADGLPVQVATLTASVGRPTHVRDDQTPVIRYEGGVYRAPLALAPGAWIIHVTATAQDGTEFRQRIDHYAGDRVN